MDIAKDERNAWLIKLDEASSPALIQSQIKAFSFVQRKHIVEERIVVGEFHLAANRYDHEARLEALIFLHQFRDLGWLLLRCCDPGAQRREPDDRLGCVLQGMTISH